MKKCFAVAVISLFMVCPITTWSATKNVGDNPTFIVLQAISNGWDQLAAGTLDIEVEIEGSVVYRLSEDTSFVGDGSNLVARGNWKTVIIDLIEYPNRAAVLRLVDNSSSRFIAVNAARLNYADGEMVANGIANGFFDEGTTGWTVESGNITIDQAIVEDSSKVPYTSSYLTTSANGNADTAVIASDPVLLTPVSSFVYGIYAGAVSSRWDNTAALTNDDNGLFVYIDLGTETTDPDGEFTAGTDIPLTGFYYQAADDFMEACIINTSGHEGKRAQFVAVDISTSAGMTLDAIRMNYDNSIIRNGGFEEGFEGGILPPDFSGDEVRIPEDHPASQIPGWTVNTVQGFGGEDLRADGDTFTFFGAPGSGSSRSGRVQVGSGSFDFGDSGPDVSGIELRSDVFVITAIPDKAESVFFSYNSAQSSNRITSGFVPETGEQRSAIEMQVDVNDNGSFGDVEDFAYAQQNQGISWAREQFGEVDEWHFPEYRSYISEEHQGMTGRIYVAETMTGGWAWMAVDDFYFWNGAEGVLAFPNSDFEMGDMTHWSEDNTSTGFTSWLASNTPADQPVAPADQTAMNGIVTWIDGNWSADSAPTEVASGDNSTGEMFSDPFTIPTLVTSPVREWSLY